MVHTGTGELALAAMGHKVAYWETSKRATGSTGGQMRKTNKVTPAETANS